MIQVVRPDWTDRKRGRKLLASFHAGLRRLGLESRIVSLDRATPSQHPMVCFGVFKKKFKERTPFRDLQINQVLKGGDLIILERGFVHREDYYSVGFDDIAGRGRYPHRMGNTQPDRWNSLNVKLWPYDRGTGNEILVIGQVPWDTSCQHEDHSNWVHNTVRALRKMDPDSKIVFRPHPLARHAVPTAGLEVDMIDRKRDLDDALDSAKEVWTFSSTVGVDATIRGVEAHAADRTSMIYEWENYSKILGGKEGGRLDWAHWIAYCQWTLEEIERGLAWKHLYPEMA